MSENKNQGFSLIELIVALAVIMVAIMLFGLALSSLPLTKSSRNRNIAYHAAAQKMEELRNTAFAALPGTQGFSYPIFTELESASGQLTVVSYQGSSEIMYVTVVVSWIENATSQSVRLDTLISNTGLNN